MPAKLILIFPLAFFGFLSKASEAVNPGPPRSLKAMLECNIGVYHKIEEDKLKKLFEYYKNRADQGDAEAMAAVGYMYKYGSGVPADYDQYIEYTKQAASAGSPSGIAGLSRLYRGGEIFEKDIDKAFELAGKAAALGSIAGLASLASMYHHNELPETMASLTEEDRLQKITEILKPVEGQNCRTDFFLANAYLSKAESLKEGLELMKTAAESGSIQAMFVSGFLSLSVENYRGSYAWFSLAEKEIQRALKLLRQRKDPFVENQINGAQQMLDQLMEMKAALAALPESELKKAEKLMIQSAKEINENTALKHAGLLEFLGVDLSSPAAESADSKAENIWIKAGKQALTNQ